MTERHRPCPSRQSGPVRRARPTRRAALPTTGLLALALALTALTGCADGDDGKRAASAEPSVVAPGKPGEAARTLSPQEARKARGGDTKPNAADFRYVRMMITHHRQALTMTALTGERARNPKVKKLSERIEAAQGPEIEMMRGWLKQHAADASGNGAGAGSADGERGEGGAHGDGHGDHGAHEGHEGQGSGHGDHGKAAGRGGSADGGDVHAQSGHSGGRMPGMASPAQLKQLREARGAEYDALFVRLMTAHHRGAVTMATELLSGGNDVRVGEMATDVIAQQNAEIDRMRKVTSG